MVRTRKPSPYQVAQLRSRQRADQITAATLQDTVNALDDYILAVVKRARKGKTGGAELIRIRQLQAARNELYERLELSYSTGITLTNRDVRDAYKNAQKEFTRVVQSQGGVFQSLGPVNQGAAFIERTQDILDARQWKTVLRKHVLNADQEVNAIVSRAIADGMSPPDLAKRLRRHVIASEDLYVAFGKKRAQAMIDDFRKLPQGYRKYAKQIRYQAQRIAITEIAHARRQAIVVESLADPNVRTIRWKRRLVSTGRKKRRFKRRPCACDILEQNDLYGLGKGIYPVNRVPFLPHPFCRCEMIPVLSKNPVLNKPQGRLQLDENKIKFSKLATPRAKEAAIDQARFSL